MGGQIAAVGGYRAQGDDGPEIDGSLGGEIEGGESDAPTIDHFAPAGDDSPPLPDDYALVVALDGESELFGTAGYSDETDKVAEPGEKRIYARDPNGAVVSEAHLQGDGSIAIAQTGGASIAVAADGAITIDSGAANIAVASDGTITLTGTTVSLQAGTPLGEFLSALHEGITAWVPVPQDGGAALKAALATWLAKPPPAP